MIAAILLKLPELDWAGVARIARIARATMRSTKRRAISSIRQLQAVGTRHLSRRPQSAPTTLSGRVRLPLEPASPRPNRVRYAAWLDGQYGARFLPRFRRTSGVELMTPEHFVGVLREVVRDSAVSGTLSVLEQPPGRRPKGDLLQMAEWYAGLDTTAKAIFANALKHAADGAVFGFLCVLDGVRAIEDGPDKGALKLIYSGKSERVLNGENVEMLHDLYNADR